MNSWKGFVGLGLLVALLAWPEIPHVPYDALNTAIIAAGYCIAALSIVLLIGMVGQISLGQASLVGIGAFAAALTVKKLHLDLAVPLINAHIHMRGLGFPFTLVTGAAAGAILAALIGAVALRVRGLYLAVATLIFAYVCDQYLFAQPWLVESQSGTSIPFQVIGTRGQIPFFDLSDAHIFYYVAVAVAGATVYALANLRESRIGRAFSAIRGSEVAASSLGINVTRYKLMGFMLAGGIAGMGGALQLAATRSVTPGQFNFQTSLYILSIAVVGGLRSIGGAVASALLFALLVGEVFFRFPAVGNYLTLTSAVVLIVVLLFFRGGLGAVPERIGQAWRRYHEDVLSGANAGRPAGFWIRAAAYLLDLPILVGIMVVLGTVTGIGPALSGALRSPQPDVRLSAFVLIDVIALVVWIAYFVPTWQRGATIGMRAVGLELVDTSSGRRISYPRAMLRALMLQVAFAPAWIGVLWVAWDPRRQGWHDKVARTQVVYARKRDVQALQSASGSRPLVRIIAAVGSAAGGLMPGGRRHDERLALLDITALVNRMVPGEEADVIPLHRAGEPKDSLAVKALLRAAAGNSAVAGEPTADGRRAPVLLRAEHITVRFGGLTAVDNASLQVGAGEIVGLIGPNGAGKTTLFNSVLGLNQPAAGRVHIFGREVTGWAVHRRAALGVGRTFQILQLFADLTVFENLLVATHLQNPTGLVGGVLVTGRALRAEHAARARVRAVLRLMDLEHLADRRVAGLPFGVLRLVEVARTLVTGARVVCFDEPASGLDSRETEGLIEWFRLLRQIGITLLVIEHDVDMVVRLCDYIYVLDQGKLIAEGTPAQIQRDQSVIDSYLGKVAEAS